MLVSAVQKLEFAVLTCSFVSDSLRPRGLQPSRPLCPWGFPGKDTGVGFLLWGSSRPRARTQVSCVSYIGRQILYHCVSWEVPILKPACAHTYIYINTYVSPPSTPASHPLGHHRAPSGVPRAVHSSFPLAVYFTLGNVHI